MPAFIPAADPDVWAGCRLATHGADFWHAADDFAATTLCGLPLDNSDLSEDKVRRDMAGHVVCLQVAAARVTPTADDRLPALGDV